MIKKSQKITLFHVINFKCNSNNIPKDCELRPIVAERSRKEIAEGMKKMTVPSTVHSANKKKIEE